MTTAKQTAKSAREFILHRGDIEAMPGAAKVHFLNPGARRTNKSLGDATGLTGFGIHHIEVPAGAESTEYHSHQFEDECVYVLSGVARLTLDGRQRVATTRTACRGLSAARAVGSAAALKTSTTSQ